MTSYPLDTHNHGSEISGGWLVWNHWHVHIKEDRYHYCQVSVIRRTGHRDRKVSLEINKMFLTFPHHLQHRPPPVDSASSRWCKMAAHHITSTFESVGQHGSENEKAGKLGPDAPSTTQTFTGMRCDTICLSHI